MQIQQVMITGQHQAELQRVELSEQLGRDELLIETEYSFISAGTELSIYTGTEPKVHQPGSWCSYPWNSGYANVGIVREVGSGVTGIQTGDRVFSFGRHASVIKMSQKRMVAKVPPGLDPKLAAASRMAGVAATSAILSVTNVNDWVVVFGLGMVGNMAAQFFQGKGCRVLGVDPVESRRKVAESCGILRTFGGSPEEVQQEVARLTGGNLCDISVDAVGHTNVVMQAMRATAKLGQVVLLGSPRAEVQGNITAVLSEIHLRNITVRGALEWCLPQYSDFPGRTSLYSKQLWIFDWLEQGKLRLDPLVSHVMGAERIKEAYDGLLHKPEEFTGVILDWGGL
ncbi:MAG: dehydrogenase [Paenibacillaceae bacterium]|jgi:2-desacetyl-2-hydroxyethyl bacteriochlorophyllide A dehydrogenase|nr:dehydrogenase [Paenibacillaceae bacterium]